MPQYPDLTAIRDAAARIKPYAHRTPIFTSSYINERVQADVYFKCENFQKVGAFKFRGACNAVMSLSEHEARNGVVTHSSGNHAAALSLAARFRNIKAHIVMPQNAPAAKIEAVRSYGGQITFCQPTLEARESTAAAIIEQTGAALIHPYNDYRIIAGQATAALELIQDIDHLDIILTPVGGGGLLSGSALSAHYLAPDAITTLAAEPVNADDARRSLEAGRLIPADNPDTIADGLRTSLGDKTFPIIRDHVRKIITVSEQQIIDAMRLTWQRMKIIIEPSSAVPVAALLDPSYDFRNKKVAIILTGGNVDLDHLPWQ